MAKRIKKVEPPKDKLDLLVETTAKTNQLLEGLVNALQGLTKQPAVSTIEEPEKPKGRRGRPPRRQITPEAERPKVNPLNGKPWIDFGTLPESKRERKDTITDKKLWGKNQPTERRHASSRITINCGSCNKPCKVLPEEVEGLGGTTYKCNACIVKGQGGR